MTQKIYVDKCRIISLTKEGLFLLTPDDNIVLIQPEITEKIFDTITRFKASPNTAFAGSTFSEHSNKPKPGYATGGSGGVSTQAELFCCGGGGGGGGAGDPEVIVSTSFIQGLFKRIGILEAEWPVGTRNAPVWKASRKRELPLPEMDTEHIENTIAWLKKRRQNIHKEMSYVNRCSTEEYDGDAVLQYWRDWEDKFEAELKRRNVR